MDWIQLVLPTEGMQAAILAYRDSFAKDDDLPQIDWNRIILGGLINRKIKCWD